LLETEGQEREAAIADERKVRISAIAVMLLHAARSSVLPDDYRARVEQQLTRCLA
jgi:hypothetical protein